MPALLKLSRSIENLRDSFQTQPSSFDKKKNYVYKRLVGRGTFGKVLHAKWHDPNTLHDDHHHGKQSLLRKPVKKDVALKVVKKSALKKEDKSVVASEVSILRKLNHKNVIRFFDTFESRSKHYIAFEFCTGGELFERLMLKGGKFTEADAKHAIRSILHGVEYLHANGIVHHDLKPENILLRSKAADADIVLADFGAARHMKSHDHLLFCDTGTYDYSPPEIFTRVGHGTKLDIWAVGVITHAILSGMMPFPNLTLSILKESILRCELAFEGRYWSKVTPTAKSFVSYLIHADQKTRPTASEALAHPWLSPECELDQGEVMRSEDGSTVSRESADIMRRSMAAPMKSVPDLPGLRENFSSIARARWRIAIDSAIAVNRLKEAGANATRRRTRESESMMMSMQSRMDTRSTFDSLRTSTRSTFECDLEEEANSDQRLKELEKLLAQGTLERCTMTASPDSQFASSSLLSDSPSPSPEPEPGAKSSQLRLGTQPHTRPQLRRRPPRRGESGSTSETSGGSSFSSSRMTYSTGETSLLSALDADDLDGAFGDKWCTGASSVGSEIEESLKTFGKF